MGYLLNSWIRKTIKWAVLIICLVFIVFPIYWTISSSFKQRVDIINPEQKFIFTPTLEAYAAVLGRGEFWRSLKNSLIITTSVLLLTFLLGTPASYVLGRYTFRHRENLYFWVYSLRFLPGCAALLPFLAVWMSLGLFDTLISIVFTYLIIALPIFIVLATQQFRTIPPAIEEAAKLDGCGPFQIFAKISLPIISPSLLCIALLCFISVWNDFMFAFILTRDWSPLSVYASAYAWIGMSVPWAEVCVCAFLLTLPPLALVMAFRRLLVRFFIGGF